MNKLISKNYIKRFKDGGIPKYQFSGILVKLLLENDKNKYNSLILDNLKQKSQNIQTTTEKAIKKNKLIAQLLLHLWNSGAFKGVIDKRTGKQVTFERAVDGFSGPMTNLAVKNEKTLVQNKLTSVQNKQTPNVSTLRTNGLAAMREMTHAARTGGMSKTTETLKSKGRSVENTLDFINHNPGLILFEDMDRAISNRLTETLFGIRPFKGRTITSLPSMLTEELKKQVKFARSKGKNAFDADLYHQMYGYNYGSRNGANGENRSGLLNRMNTPSDRIEHTLGAYNFYTDEQGNTIVLDTYDFNVGLKQGGNGIYAAVRNFAGEFASKSTDPNEGKIKYNINLGKL